jgi:EAL domain-containing protein (putative c-di-GMP-specific phosphodiesterase class I)/CheY-like chemotaxis protein
VLLVDDDEAIRRTLQKKLARQGLLVDVATNGKEAAGLIAKASYDVIVTDLSMPEMSGLEFLKVVRSHDVEVPVILMTGVPTVESAMVAIEHGAFRYLSKPFDPAQLTTTITHAARLRKLARLKREALELPGGQGARLGDRIALEVRFNWAMGMLWPAFQPIVDWKARRVMGFEALMRSDEPLMKNPADILDAAERLNALHDLGRAIRAKVAKAAVAPELGDAQLFVNLHSADLKDPDLYSQEAPLTAIAHRVVLEITERASLDEIKNVSACITALKKLGFRIAIDDLGAGYAGLTSFTQLDPEVVKVDMSLVRGVDQDPKRQSILRSMKALCDDLSMLVVAEGVETREERATLELLGYNLFQGYLFAKPTRGFEQPRY